MSSVEQSGRAGTGAAGPVNVAVIGLEFGAEFVPIYADHPDVGEVVLCDRDEALVARAAARFGVRHTSSDLAEVLADDNVHAVHVVTGLRDHATHTVQALEAGKHVACAVPMALSIEEIAAVQAAQRRSGLTYMMMETAVYTREFLFVQDLIEQGWFGDITFGRGSHIQDMTNWPGYWVGLPPMYYLTHALAPLLAGLKTHVKSVRALGSGRYDPSAEEPYGPTFPVECAIFDLVDHPAALEITRSLGRFARSYTEAFSLYGSERSFEWPQLECEGNEPLTFELLPDEGPRGRGVSVGHPRIGDQQHRLPVSLVRHLTAHQSVGADGVPFTQGGGHGGSHPHLVDEFVSAVRDGRPASIDQVRAAQWTAPGLLAHESAVRGGAVIEVPSFTD